jgi:peptidoglycan/xylan/chitin deacetylase (PgdA/CDA1 family)
VWHGAWGRSARLAARRGALRTFSTALITAGLVVLADVGLTLAWQEPVSSLYGSIKQGQAEDELADLESSYPTAADLAAIAGYATFDYRVEKTDTVDPSEVGVVRKVDHERLVPTACHPLYSADERYVVFAPLERIVIFDAARGGPWPAG